jgi:hypothetical protein
MDRNGKKPKAKQGDLKHPERSDTKAHNRDESETSDAATRAATEKAETDERIALKNQHQKGPQRL